MDRAALVGWLDDLCEGVSISASSRRLETRLRYDALWWDVGLFVVVFQNRWAALFETQL